MAQMNYSCGIKEQMITEMQSLRRQCPGKETVNLLFPAAEDSADNSLCSLLTYPFYYGYCKDCTVPLSEEARTFLAQLLGKQELIMHKLQIQKKKRLIQ